ncbi:hypothetical protein SVIRM249S_07101 [Streptomyces viridochromogenes]
MNVACWCRTDRATHDVDALTLVVSDETSLPEALWAAATTKAPVRAPQPSALPAAAADPQQHPRTPPAFRAVLRHRYCGRLLIGSVSGRLSLGMVPVALILAAQADGHSLARAGVLAALYGIAPALGLPLLGRLADLRGLLLPCCLGAALVAVALGTLAVAGTARLPLAVGCAVLAGAGCPPREGGLRSLWHAVLPDDAHVRTAYTLDFSTQEIVYVSGQALAVTVGTWLSPAAALAGAVTVAGCLALATVPSARAWRAAPRRREQSGVLRPPAMRLLLASLVFLGATIGALDVAAIAVAQRQDASWLAGVLPAAFSAADCSAVPRSPASSPSPPRSRVT